MCVDPHNHTMATLYGNEIAFKSLNPRRADVATAPSYMSGTVLALVTWNQREDPHWFGARIPDAPQSIEFVQVGSEGESSYRRFDGAELGPTTVEPTTAAMRVKLIPTLTPARLP